MASKLETLLTALLTGEDLDFTPQSRSEEYLENCIDGDGTTGLPNPQSRLDSLLYKLAEKGVSSGTNSEEVVTLNDKLEQRLEGIL